MTSVQSYRVIVTGKKLIEDNEAIRQKLIEIFDLPEQQLNALLSSKPLVIKKNITAPHAMKFKKALTQCGLECMVEPMDEDSIVQAADLDEQKPAVPAPESRPVSPAAEEAKATAAVQAPVTTVAVETLPAKKPEPVKHDAAARAAADQTVQAVDPSNRSIPPSLVGKKAEDIVAPDLLVAPPGSRIGPRPTLVHADLPEIDHLSAGFADRLAPATEKGPPPPNVDHLDVAPAGTSLSDVKKVKPLEIDLSHLSLDRNN